MPDGQPTPDLRRVAELFETFARVECRGSSPLYERLSLGIAGDDDLLSLASHARTPIPNLFLGAVHLALLDHRDDPLARHYPTRAPGPGASGDPVPPFRRFCLSHRDRLMDLMRTRHVQTNEVRRCGYLLPAFHLIGQRERGRPLALVEVGASAGLNLCWDMFRYAYGDGRTWGPTESPLRIDIEVRGDAPPPLPAAPIAVGQRIGLDLRPIAPGDADGVTWLEALIWPEHDDRRLMLRQALAIAARTDLRLVAGDASVTLPDVLRDVSPDLALCVFQTHSLNQFTADARERLFRALSGAGQHRAVYFLSRHNELTLSRFDPHQRESWTLAECDGHGRWFRWLGPAVLA